MRKRVAVGMSGGIDSSVAAYLLKKEGYDVVGITMTLWREGAGYPDPATPGSCYSSDKKKDYENILKVSSLLDIPHYFIDCSHSYEENVLEDFKRGYMGGRTPNPCIWCNELVKFGYLLEKAREEVDFDYFATGHYARLSPVGDRMGLFKGVDEVKDQSYFLSRLSQKQLSDTIFPLGGLKKDEVRKIDEELGFHEKGEVESQDFYGGDYRLLLSQKERKGNIVLPNGRKVGEHKGYWNYTIGQRKGLGIAYKEPLYVISIDSVTNTVTVGPGALTMRKALVASNVVYSSLPDFSEKEEYTVKVRSVSKGISARLRHLEDGKILFSFSDEVNAITPGQSAVCYRGDMVVLSSIIESVL